MFIKVTRKDKQRQIQRINVDLIKHYHEDHQGTMFYFTDGLGTLTVFESIDVIDKLMEVKDATNVVRETRQPTPSMSGTGAALAKG